MNSFFRYLLPILILGVSLAISFVIVAQAETESTDSELAAKGVTFPVSELGNCGSKSECRDYCNQAANMGACVSFARSHGLMNADEASRAEKFRQKLQSSGGPGGCTSPESCKSYCSDEANKETCIKFAEEEGLKHENIEKAKKYREFKQLIEKGETPGGCASKEACESYCSEEQNKGTCIAFAKRMGLVDEKRAEEFRSKQFSGPGGCNSAESCRAYCNGPTNQETCLKFAEEKGFIKEGEASEAKENFMRLKEKFSEESKNVSECLKSSVGTNIIEDIRAGKLTPGTEINDRVKSCFEGRDEGRDIKPANFGEIKRFIKEGTSTDLKTRQEFLKEKMMQEGEERPGLNKETFEKFRQREGSEGFNSEQLRQKFEQFRVKPELITPGSTTTE